MTHFDIHNPTVECARCVVCEKDVSGNHWFAQVKHHDWTIRLCSQRCANAFYAQRLPGLRRLMLLAAHPLRKWPRLNVHSKTLAADL